MKLTRLADPTYDQVNCRWNVLPIGGYQSPFRPGWLSRYGGYPTRWTTQKSGPDPWPKQQMLFLSKAKDRLNIPIISYPMVLKAIPHNVKRPERKADLLNIYKRTNVMQLGSMFVCKCNIALHVSDAFCVHSQEHLETVEAASGE